MRKAILFGAVLLALCGATLTTSVHAVKGMWAFCAHKSHGAGGWNGTCFSDGKSAYAEMKRHEAANPGHWVDTTTMPCER
jgi:hypothetical protein